MRVSTCGITSRLSSNWISIIQEALALVLPGVLFLIFRPGFLDGDSLALLWYAREGWFDDFQSPLLGVIWRLLLPLGTPGHGGSVLAAQIILLSLSLNLFLRAMGIRGWHLVWITGITVLFPSIGGYAGALVKDVWFGISVVAAYALVYLAGQKNRIWLLIPATIFITCSIQFRGNGFPIVFPLLFLPLFWPGKKTWKKRVLGASAIVFASLAGPWLANGILQSTYRIERSYPSQTIFLKDLVYLSIRSEKNLIPEEFNQMELSLDDFEAKWNLTTCNDIFQFNRPRKEALNFSRNKESIRNLRGIWLQEILNNPKDYITFRIRFTWVFFFSHQHQSWVQWIYHHPKVPENNLFNMQYEPATYKEVYFGLSDLVEFTPFARAYPYLIMIVFAMGLQASHRRSKAWPLIIFLSLGVLFYYTVFAAVSPHFCFRYLWLLSFSAFPLSLSSVYLHYSKEAPQEAPQEAPNG